MIILDQAGWHTTRKLKVPKNLTMLSLPPACPELNAAENIWQYLRQTYLSNRVFKTYTDILDACQTGRSPDAAAAVLVELVGRARKQDGRSWLSRDLHADDPSLPVFILGLSEMINVART